MEASGANFYKHIRFGRCIESLKWFSVLSIKAMGKSIDELVDHFDARSDRDIPLVERAQTTSYRSLLDRVLVHDFGGNSETVQVNKRGEMTCDRIQSLTDDRLLLDSHELLQRDLYFNTPLHYFLNADSELLKHLQTLEEGEDAKSIHLTTMLAQAQTEQLYRVQERTLSLLLNKVYEESKGNNSIVSKNCLDAYVLDLLDRNQQLVGEFKDKFYD